MEDRSCLVRFVVNVRHLVCSTQNVGDQLLDHLRVLLYPGVIHEATEGLIAVHIAG